MKPEITLFSDNLLPRINLETSKFGEMVAFYLDIVGLRLEYSNTQTAIFLADGIKIVINKAKENVPTRYRESITFDIAVENVDAQFKMMNKKGVVFIHEPQGTSWDTSAASFYDPDGNKISIISYPQYIRGIKGEMRNLGVKEYVWTPFGSEIYLEHVRLSNRFSNIIFIDGMLLYTVDGSGPTNLMRLNYHILCDQNWHIQRIRLRELSPRSEVLDLVQDSPGYWLSANRSPIPYLNGCYSVSIPMSSFVNTIILNQLKMRSGSSRDIQLIQLEHSYPTLLGLTPEGPPISFLTIACTEKNDNSSKYSISNPGVFTGDFKHLIQEISTDKNGVVMDIPSFSKRLVWRQ